MKHFKTLQIFLFVVGISVLTEGTTHAASKFTSIDEGTRAQQVYTPRKLALVARRRIRVPNVDGTDPSTVDTTEDFDFALIPTPRRPRGHGAIADTGESTSGGEDSTGKDDSGKNSGWPRRTRARGATGDGAIASSSNHEDYDVSISTRHSRTRKPKDSSEDSSGVNRGSAPNPDPSPKPGATRGKPVVVPTQTLTPKEACSFAPGADGRMLKSKKEGGGCGGGGGAAGAAPDSPATTPSSTRAVPSPRPTPTRTPTPTPTAARYPTYTHFSQTWVPGFCKMNAAKKPEQCLDAESDQKAYWNRGLIAHGLWPIASTYRSTRSMTKLIYNSVIRGITRRFFYPNLFESISSPNAWKVGKHEWEAHGKYSGLNPTKYLQDTVRINTALAAPAYLGAHAGSVVNTNELKAQFPSEACLVCKYDSKSKQNYLFEVRYCLSVNHPGLTTGGVVPYAKCDICNSCNKNNTEIPRMQ